MSIDRRSINVNTTKLTNLLEKREKELDGLIKEFQDKHLKINYDKLGNEKNMTNPLLVSTFFFKTINPVSHVKLVYTAEQLSLVYDLYLKIVEKVNLEIMIFQPTLSHFAKFSGLSLEDLKELRHSVDEPMRILINQINSDTFDANMILAQHNKITSTTTTYRMKVENDMIERNSPTFNVSVSTKAIDLDKINERLYEIQSLSKKQINYEGK